MVFILFRYKHFCIYCRPLYPSHMRGYCSPFKRGRKKQRKRIASGGKKRPQRLCCIADRLMFIPFYSLIFSNSVKFTPKLVKVTFNSIYLSCIELYVAISLSFMAIIQFCSLENTDNSLFVSYLCGISEGRPEKMWKIKRHVGHEESSKIIKM